MIINHPKITCKRCSHTWVPRKREVLMCPNPKCRSRSFDKPMPNPVGRPRGKYYKPRKRPLTKKQAQESVTFMKELLSTTEPEEEPQEDDLLSKL